MEPSLRIEGVLLGFLAAWGPWILRCIVGFAALFVTFGYLKSKATFDGISERLTAVPVARGFFAAHVAAMVLAGALTLALYKTTPLRRPGGHDRRKLVGCRRGRDCFRRRWP